MENKKLAAKARNRYQREWRKRNPDKQKQYIERYWMKKAQQMLNRKEGKNQLGNGK